MGNSSLQPTKEEIIKRPDAATTSPQTTENKKKKSPENNILEPLFGNRGVPMVFRWEHGGENVCITGTFNDWSTKGIPMSRSGNNFVHVQELTREKHAYKFIINNQSHCDSEQPLVVDKSGNLSNFLDLTRFEPKFEHLPDISTSLASKYLDESLYDCSSPELSEYVKEPPWLPPQISRSLINDGTDMPEHMASEHLYCINTPNEEQTAVLRMSQRFRKNYVTTIYYGTADGGYPGIFSSSGGKQSSSSRNSGKKISSSRYPGKQSSSSSTSNASSFV